MKVIRRIKNKLLLLAAVQYIFSRVGNLLFLCARFYDYCLGEYYKSKLLYCGIDVGILKGVTFDHPETISIGDHTWIGHYAHIRGGGNISIGKYCQIANNVIIVTGNHKIDGSLYYDYNEYKDIFIGDNIWIASNAIILPGVKIGNNSVIAAGAVVTKDVPENVIVAGIPAIQIGRVPMQKRDYQHPLSLMR